MKFRYIGLLFTFVFFTQLSFSQTLRGKATAKFADHMEAVEDAAVMYGNVEAYDVDGKLVGSVLTDDKGNYTLNFKDTGTYEIRVMYAGYDNIVEKIRVTKDEVGDFEMERDETKKIREYYSLPVASETASHITDAYKVAAGGIGRSDASPGLSRVASHMARSESYLGSASKLIEEKKGLTAAEINDFAKWDMWNDYVETELKTYQKIWNINPQKRYVVQIMNEQRSPVLGAEVRLYTKRNKLIWKAITDNTGKAELWGELEETERSISYITVGYKGESEKIRRPTEFKKGINILTLDVPCDPFNMVDVAFVVDATGSMGDEIEYIKQDLNTVIYNSQNIYQDVALRYGSVFYRDKGDAYVVKHKDFTNVLSEALVYIDEQGAAGGGDLPEAVDVGLETAIEELSWSLEARARLLFLILDAPAHNDAATIAKIRALTEKAAAKGIKIIPVAASGINKSGEYLMRSMALCTNGTYIFLTDHSGIGNSHIEPSTDEYEVELLTDLLTTVIKNNMYYPECDAEIPDLALNYPDSIVEYPFNFDNHNGDTLGSVRDSLTVNDTIVRTDSIPNNYDPIDPFKWKFYPNPTQDIVNIEATENVKFIYLTDFTGKILQRIDLSGRKTIQVSLGRYPAGIYLLRYPIGKQWATGKIVLMR